MSVKKIGAFRTEVMDFSKFKETWELARTPLSEIKKTGWQGRRKQYYESYKEDFMDVIDEVDRWVELARFLHKESLTLEQLYQVYSDSILRSETEPIKFEEAKEDHRDSLGKRVKSHGPHWVFKGHIYSVSETFTDDQVELMILDEFDKERRKFERLGLKFDDNELEEGTYLRPRVPEKVRIEVWRRDGGKCARCGSREKLEYDHIVPISKGGSNTARNIELLCQDCNRAKGNRIE